MITKINLRPRNKNIKALVLLSDCLASLGKKGELTYGYYNPCNIFNEIYFPEFCNEKVLHEKVQQSAGKAKVILIPAPIRSWRRYLMMLDPRTTPASVLKSLGKIIKKNKINLIRCYGHRFNLVLGAKLKKITGLPLVVSLHTNPDVDIFNRESNLFRKLLLFLFDRTETRCLQEADLVIAVYHSIVPYLRKRKIRRYQVIYNSVQV